MLRLPTIPASFFGIILGLAGLGSAWRQASRVWGLPHAVGECIMAVAAAVWALLLVLYLGKWILMRQDAVGETRHPIQCCFVGLVGVSTMLVAGAALPYSRLAAEALFALGATFTLAFALWRTGQLWHGERDPATTTAVLYLPTVAGSFVTAIVASTLGHPDWGQLAFGAGLFSWLAIESVLLTRLYTAPALLPALRPTLGIQLAPPTVGLLAFLSVADGPPGLLAHALLGYGLLQALLLIRLLPWIREQAFAPSYWGFSFGATAIATAPIVMIGRGDIGPAMLMAPYLFGLANLLIGLLALATLRLWFQGRLLPQAAPTAPSA